MVWERRQSAVPLKIETSEKPGLPPLEKHIYIFSYQHNEVAAEAGSIVISSIDVWFDKGNEHQYKI